MSESFDLNIDRECILFDGEWLSTDDLTTRIKEKINAGDFRVARHSMALQQLEETLANISAVEIKLTPEVLDTYQQLADFEERSVALVLRRALVYYLGSEDAAKRLYEMRRAEKGG